MVSIIVLVYNANQYTRHTLKTLRKTKGVKYEVIVLDNNSKYSTFKMLGKLKQRGYIDKIISLNENSYFVKGNNIASQICSKDSEYILLLNSDVEIRNSLWLNRMVAFLKENKGAIATEISSTHDNRPDGWCYLVSKDIYLNHPLDEDRFKHLYSIAKFNGDILKNGYKVFTIKNYEDFIYHFGGKSGKTKNLKGMDTSEEELRKWFGYMKCEVVDHLELSKGEKYTYNLHLIWIRHNFYRQLSKVKQIAKRIGLMR